MRVFTQRGREFDPKTLRAHYRSVHPDVIADLAEFCLAGVSAMADTDRETVHNLGRQAVWLHVNKFFSLDTVQIEEIYAGKGVFLTEGSGDENQ